MEPFDQTLAQFYSVGQHSSPVYDKWILYACVTALSVQVKIEGTSISMLLLGSSCKPIQHSNEHLVVVK